MYQELLNLHRAESIKILNNSIDYSVECITN